MSGQTSDEVIAKVRGGELDARRVLLTPEAAPGAAELTVEALLAADETLTGIGSRAWDRLEGDRAVRIGDLDADRRAWIADLVSFWRTTPRDVSRVTSPQDGMYARTPDYYFPTGALALRCVRLAMLEAGKDRCESLLDFACGYGRALRFFRAVFPGARLTAADISRDAVDFCAQEFGATPVYSGEDFSSIDLPGPFDVIWVGSLFTHVPEPQWIELLELLVAALAADGLLVFTVQGRKVREELVTGEPPWDPLDDAAKAEIVRGFDETGYGYADWRDVTGYGTSLNSPAWVCAQIQQRPGLRLVGYRETGWGRQDVVSCQAKHA